MPAPMGGAPDLRCPCQMMPLPPRTPLLTTPRLPIDLVSETSESDGNASDSDNSSDVAVVEPVEQAAAEVPGAADMLAASDFAARV